MTENFVGIAIYTHNLWIAALFLRAFDSIADQCNLVPVQTDAAAGTKTCGRGRKTGDSIPLWNWLGKSYVCLRQMHVVFLTSAARWWMIMYEIAYQALCIRPPCRWMTWC